MAVCESCGKTFDVASLPAEVSSSRLLCAPCYWKRQADKAASKPKSASPASPAASKAPDPAPARRPELAEKATATATAAPARHEPKSHASPAGHAMPHSRHAAKRKETDTPLKPGEPPPIVDKATKIGGILAIVFVAIAAGVFVVVRNMKNDEDLKAAAETKARTDFLADLKSKDLATMEAAIEVRSKIDSSQGKWVGSDIDKEVSALRVRAESFIESEHDKIDYFERLSKLEAAEKDSSGKSSQELLDLRRRADALKLSAASYGKEAESRVSSLHDGLTQLIGTRFNEEALKYADESGKSDPKGAMQKLGAAEDEVRHLWEGAVKDKNSATKAAFEQYLQTLIAKSDGVAGEYFTDAEIEKVPWRDLILGDTAREWREGAAKGFVWKCENGVLSAKGPDADAKGKGLLAIGDKEKWRDFVLDAEFKLESGKIRIAFRVGNNIDANTDKYDVACEEGSPIVAGGTYAFTYRVVGSKVVMKWKDDVFAPLNVDLSWYFNRSGAFVVVVDKGAAVKFTRLRIRELR